MKQKRKTRKMPEATVYAIRTEDGKWISEGGTHVSFAKAFFALTRRDATDCIWALDGPCTVVPCRVRVLPSAKKAPRRTR